MNDNFNQDSGNTPTNPPGYFTMNDPPAPPEEKHPPYTGGSGYQPTGDSGFRPPHQEGYTQPVAYEQPQQQYSTTSGWQQPNAPAGHGAATAAPRKKRRGLMVLGIMFATVLSVSILAFAGIGVMNVINTQYDEGQLPSSEPSINVPVENMPGITLQDRPEGEAVQLPSGRMTTEQIVEKVEPSVVAITNYMNVSNYQATGMGSGIIIREDGYIVTNAHVVENARGITVQMSDGEAYEGRLIAIDSKTDLAVIKVDATGLPFAEFGNSEQIKVGEKVIAIGNPQSMEFYGSVTQGIVSGLNRKITARGTDSVTTYANLIQTDAAINPGNSGGALVNEYGQVIGINSAKVIAEGAEGMGFAIPSADVKPIINDLIQHGYVTGRVRLGITASPINEALAQMNGVPTGVVVQATEEGSDISRKGVVPGDIITAIGGEPIVAFEDLTNGLKGKNPGDTVRLTIYRVASRSTVKGRSFDVEVVLLEDKGVTGTTVVPQEQTEQTPSGGQTPNTAYPDGFEDLWDYFN